MLTNSIESVDGETCFQSSLQSPLLQITHATTSKHNAPIIIIVKFPVPKRLPLSDSRAEDSVGDGFNAGVCVGSCVSRGLDVGLFVFADKIDGQDVAAMLSFVTARLPMGQSLSYVALVMYHHQNADNPLLPEGRACQHHKMRAFL